MARSSVSQPAPKSSPKAVLEACYEIARREADEAEANVKQASTRHLAKLLRAKPEARFAALSDRASVLTPEDRGQLLASLREQAAPSRAISAGTASRWAILRSRLPYRMVSLVVRGLAVAACLGLAVLAWQRTPEGFVELAGRQALPVSWRLPDGRTMENSLTPGQRYQLLRWNGGMAQLRLWLPGQGYAETQVAQEAVKSAR